MAMRIDLTSAKLIKEYPDGSALYRMMRDGQLWEIVIGPDGEILEEKCLKGGRKSDPRLNGPVGNIVKRPI